MSDTNTIADGAVVTMHYKLTLSDGQVIDSSEGQDPLAYLHGANNIVPGLEAAMGGKTAGEAGDPILKGGPAEAIVPLDQGQAVTLKLGGAAEGLGEVQGILTQGNGPKSSAGFSKPEAETARARGPG